MTPKWCTIQHLLLIPVTNLTLFHSMIVCFWVAGHFETSAPNCAQMSVRYIKVLHVCYFSAHGSQIWLFHSYERPLQGTGHFGKVHWIPKWPWLLQGERYPMYSCFYLKFHFMASYFRVTGSCETSFWEVYLMTLKWPWPLQGQRYPMYLLASHSPKLLVSL